MNKKYILLGLLIGMSLILGLTLLTQYSKSTIQNPNNLTWNKNIIYENENNIGIIPDFDYNIRNKSYYTQNYPSHFSFENEIGLTNHSISLITDVPYTYYAEVISTLDGHDSVINMTGINIDANIICEFPFYDQESTIEFWLYKNTTAETSSISIWDDNVRCIQLYIGISTDLDAFGYLDFPATLVNTGYNYLANHWFHNRISWFDDNTFSWYINGFKIVDSHSMYINMVSGINNFRFMIQSQTTLSLDAFGHDDWVKLPYYNVNDNLVPELVVLNELEVDKFEFDYDYDTFENNGYDFYTTEPIPETNTMYIEKTNNIISDIIWYLPDIDTDYYSYLNYYTVDSDDYRLNVTASFYIDSYDSENFYITISPKTTAELYIFRVDANFNLYYYNTMTDGYIDTGYDIGLQVETEYNIYLDYYSGTGILRINDELVQIFPLFNDSDFSNVYGVDKIRVLLTKKATGTSFTYFLLHNFGVYESGISIKNDDNYGIISYDINDNKILTKRSNLLDININQDCSIYTYENNYHFIDYGSCIDLRNIHEGLEVFNLVNDFDYLDTKLIFLVYNNVSYPYYLKSEGLYLSDISVDFYPYSYFYHNSEKDDNYFYVNNNKLYYRFNNSELDNPEYMRLWFNNINYLIQENDSIGFNSFITGNYSGYIRLGYNDASFIYLYLNQSNTVKYSEYILPEGLILVDLRIVISVDDYDTAIGMTEGYIDVIHIGNRYNTYTDVIDNLDDSVLDLDFLEGIIYISIILIFLIIPCYLVYERYGKKVVIPMFILIVIVLMVSTFLPIWLSIILLISSFLFLYHTSKRDDLND